MIQLYIHIYTFFFRFFPIIVHLFNCSTLIRCVVVLHCGTNLHFPNRQWGASQVAQRWRICLPTQETQEMPVWSLGREDRLEEEMAAHPSALAREIPGTEEPGGHSPGGRTESDTTEDTHTHTHRPWCWTSFHGLICIHFCVCVKCLLSSFAHLKSWVVYFLTVENSNINIFWIQLFCQICDLQTLSLNC